MTTIRAVPASREAEQAVLGAALNSDKLLAQIIEGLPSESHFHFQNHRVIYSAILELYRDSVSCDVTTVADKIEKADRLEQVGGRVYLAELLEYGLGSSNLKAHIEIVLEKFIQRKLIAASKEIIEACYQFDGGPADLLDAAEGIIFGIANNRLGRGFVSVGELMTPALQEIGRVHREPGTSTGVLTGFSRFDKLTNGLRRSNLIIIAGRPSMGKTALALNIAEYASSKTGVAIFSMEMPTDDLLLRMLCSRARVSQLKMQGGTGTDEEQDQIVHASNVLKDAEIYIDDTAMLSPLEIRAKARRLKAQHDIGLIIVDYIQMMHSTGKHENRQQEMSYISRSLKALAKELEIPVVALSQLSRQVEQRVNKRPVLSDLRESGAIEQDADLITFVYRPEYYLTDDEKKESRHFQSLGLAEWSISKQRNGPTGVVNLTFLAEYARFENMIQQGALTR